MSKCLHWSGLAVMLMVSPAFWTSPAAATDAAPPLTIRGDNTVIVDGSTYSGRWLQYYLLRAVAKHPQAEDYAPRKQIDRSQAPAFPLVRASELGNIPDEKNILAVGPTGVLSDEDRDALGETPGTVLIRRHGRAVAIVGDERHPWNSAMAAVSLFLDRYADVRLYAPDELWLSMPEDDQFTIGQVHDLIEPYFAKTTWSHASYERNREWELMNASVSQNNPLRASHTLNHYFSPDKYYDRYPEIYEMRNNVRVRPQGQIWNPCLSAPQLADIAMEEVRERMERPSKPVYLSFGVMDMNFHCECDDCQASVQKYNGSYSNLYYTFMNKLARQVADEFPELYLTTYAYSNVRRPPVDMTIEPNIVVDYVTKTYNWVHPALAKQEQAMLLAWADTGAKWITHDWSFGGVSPREYTRQFATFLQWGAQHGMLGIYVEWSPGEQWYLDGARYWIKRRLLTDPYQDVAALWKQYCDDMYGPASEVMFRLFSHFADKYTYSSNYIHRDDLPRREMALYDEDDLAYQRQLLDAAHALAGDDELIAARLAMVERYWRGHELFARAVGEPARLEHRFKGDGINTEALAFYANDDGSLLEEAVRYYRNDRTIPPDDNLMSRQLGALESYIANYSRGLGNILGRIRLEAMSHVDLANPTADSADAYRTAAMSVLRRHLPQEADPARVEHLESMLDKVVVVPVVDRMPTIDGDLSDSIWEKAATLDAFTVRDLMISSEHETQGKVMRVGDKLVFGIICKQVGPIWARTTPDIHTGSWLWRESGVEFFFGPTPTEAEPNPPYAQFIVNAFGAFEGYRISGGQRSGVEVATRLDEEAGHYIIEAAFPLKGDRYDLTDKTALSFNLMRNVYTADTYTSDQIIGWAPIYLSAGAPESRGLLLLPR